MHISFIYALYRLLQWTFSPLIVTYFLVRGFQNRRYFSSFRERMGGLPATFRQAGPGSIWLHAVSVGETMAAVELLRKVRENLPGVRLFVSTTTLAGRSLAETKLAGIADGVFYAPLDYAFAVRRVLRALRPSVVVVLETEIWPNLFRESRRFGAGLIVVNGRISDRTVSRYAKLRWAFTAVLSHAGCILAESEENRRRYILAGAAPDRIRVGGNLKYDFELPTGGLPEALAVPLQAAGAQVWIAASTMPPARPGDVEEDDSVLGAFQELSARLDRLLLILVPRRPERFDTVAAKLGVTGIPFVRRTALLPNSRLPVPGVLLLDSIGELVRLYKYAHAIFMGGTLAERGGHNILEPALAGKPVIAGPHMENFAAIADEFTQAGALLRIPGPEGLAAAIADLLDNPAKAAELGRHARRVAQSKRGAAAKAAEAILALHRQSIPKYRAPLPLLLLAKPLSALWCAVSSWNQSRLRKKPRRLGAPAVSVGGITMGGTGKTPFVLWLAAELKRRGHNPAILTRGYRRRQAEGATVAGPGESLPVERTGDEAQILLRSGSGPVGIGADRYRTGRLIEEQFQPGVFLLDDGFQHGRLERAADIVLIDAMDPFGGEACFPLGRLREPLEALRRASAFVITRAGPGTPVEGITQRLREIHPHAQVFQSQVQPRRWTDAVSGESWEPQGLPFRNVVAFCGIANPPGFWQTLSHLGFDPLRHWTFPDHHRYTVADLRRLVEEAVGLRAEALLTTEKDCMNLPKEMRKRIGNIRLCWLHITLSVSKPEALIDLLARKAGLPQAGA